MTYSQLKANLTERELQDFDTKYTQLLLLAISLKEQIAELKEILNERGKNDECSE